LAAALLTVGCNRSTSSGPAIKELGEEAKLLKELIDTDGCVCAFSGTCLEVWLECEIKEGDAAESKTYPSLPVAIT
jgi:hypothetical protein